MSRAKRPANAPRSAPQPPGHRPPIRWRPAAVAGAIVAVVAVGVWAWQREPTPGVPPELGPDRAEPAVIRALEDARAAVLRDLRDPAAWGDLGMVFAAHAFHAEAAECYATAHRLDRSDPRWAYLLGVHHATTDPAAAIPFLEEAVAGKAPSPEHEATARCKLGETYLAAGRPADAERVFREQLDRTPADPRAALGLGQTLLAVGRTPEAVAALTTAAAGGGARKRATAQLAAAARAAGDEATAAAREREAAGLPDDPEWPDPFVTAVLARRAGVCGSFRAAHRTASPVARRTVTVRSAGPTGNRSRDPSGQRTST